METASFKSKKVAEIEIYTVLLMWNLSSE